MKPTHYPSEEFGDAILDDVEELAMDVAILIGGREHRYERLVVKIDEGREGVLGNRTEDVPLNAGDLLLLLASDLRVLLAEIENRPHA